jgi:hypothetical protein
LGLAGLVLLAGMTGLLSTSQSPKPTTEQITTRSAEDECVDNTPSSSTIAARTFCRNLARHFEQQKIMQRRRDEMLNDRPTSSYGTMERPSYLERPSYGTMERFK